MNHLPYWGKALTVKGECTRGHFLRYHCLDVAAVGNVLLETNARFRNALVGLLGFEDWAVVAYIQFFLALHDIGKFSFRFQGKVPELYRVLYGEPCEPGGAVDHCALGQALWKRKLLDICISRSWLGQIEANDTRAKRVLNKLMHPFAGHHGMPAAEASAGFTNFNETDLEAAHAFTKDITELFSMSEVFSAVDWRAISVNITRASWYLAGTAVLCDWIGSGISENEFVNSSVPLDIYWKEYALPRARDLVSASGVLPSLPSESVSMGSLFRNISTPSPLQNKCETLHLNTSPQLVIIQDVTGAGKTEAALLLAKRMVNAGLADGIFVALPTMATANAMYERLQTYFRSFFATKDASLVLSHSSRDISEQFTKTVLGSWTSGQVRASMGMSQCFSWLADNRKKAFLADMGAGTVDQALLSVLPTRHQSLRLLGLSRKILVVDEIHSYDEYTNGLLKRLIEFHVSLGGSCILLSATLSETLCTSLIRTYLDALTIDMPVVRLGRQYPSLIHLSAERTEEHALTTRPDLKRQVRIEFLHSGEDALQSVLEWHSQGKAVCWIRNTVGDAIEAFAELCNRIDGDKLSLFHARFALGHRLDREQEVLQVFGKNGNAERRKGAVLVATQVVEQSLDLDFDEMVSDLAPIDLLIQRAGRVHRHIRPDRSGQIPVLTILAPPFEENPDVDWYRGFFPPASYVYPDHANLWRTQRLLMEKEGWQQPDDLRGLIESVYGEEAVPAPSELETWEDAEIAAGWAKGALARNNALRFEDGYAQASGDWTSDETAPTRLGEPTVVLRLALAQDDGRISPLCNAARFPWRMSEVSVRKCLVGEPFIPTELSEEYERTISSMPDKGKWSLLVVLREQVELDGACRYCGNVEKSVLKYDRLAGLTIMRPTEEAS